MASEMDVPEGGLSPFSSSRVHSSLQVHGHSDFNRRDQQYRWWWGEDTISVQRLWIQKDIAVVVLTVLLSWFIHSADCLTTFP